MSTQNNWRGDSLPVAQVTRFTVGGTPAAGDTVTVTMNRKSVAYTVVGGDTPATVAAGLAAAWSAASSAAAFPELRDVNSSYTAGNAYLDLTAATAGVPFAATAGATGTTTLTASSVAASSGPNHVDDPNNWSLGHTPTTGDAVVVAGGSDLLYGLGSFTADSWEVRASFTGKIGLPQWNAAGYYEYRTRYLTVNAPAVTVGSGDGSGSSRLLLNAVGSSTWNVYKTANREGQSFPALDIGMTGNPTLIQVAGGDVGLLLSDESTARTVGTVNLSGQNSAVAVGRKLTVTALNHDSGTCDSYGTVTTHTMDDGTFTAHDTAGLTNVVAYGGVLNVNCGGTIASLTGQGDGAGQVGPKFDFSANALALSVANSTFLGGAYVLDGNKRVTFDALGTHHADRTFFLNSDLGPYVTWNRT